MPSLEICKSIFSQKSIFQLALLIHVAFTFWTNKLIFTLLSISCIVVFITVQLMFYFTKELEYSWSYNLQEEIHVWILSIRNVITSHPNLCQPVVSTFLWLKRPQLFNSDNCMSQWMCSIQWSALSNLVVFLSCIDQLARLKSRALQNYS